MGKKINLGDKITPTIKIEVKGNLKNLDAKTLKLIDTKQVAFDMVEMFRNQVNKYIPVSEGNIRDHGYEITLSRSKKTPWGRLTYRNTSAVPYVMYQYVGRIWRPNYAIFDVNVEKFNPKSLKLRNVHTSIKHSGWVVSKKHPRHQTAIKFRRKKETIYVNVGLGVKKRPITMYGYGNKDSQPRWVEYTERKNSNWRSGIGTYAQRVYSTALQQAINGENKTVLTGSGNKISKTANEILGVNNNLHITTRLRKKNG